MDSKGEYVGIDVFGQEAKRRFIPSLVSIPPSDFSLFTSTVDIIGNNLFGGVYSNVVFAQRSAVPIHWMLQAMNHKALAGLPVAYTSTGTAIDDITGTVIHRNEEDLLNSIELAFGNYEPGASIAFVDTVLTGRAFTDLFPIIQNYAKLRQIIVTPHVIEGNLGKKIIKDGQRYYKLQKKRERAYLACKQDVGVIGYTAPLIFENKKYLLDSLIIPSKHRSILPMTIINQLARRAVGSATRVTLRLTSPEDELKQYEDELELGDFSQLRKWFNLL